MNFILEECLIYEEKLCSQSKNLFHVHLGDSIYIEFTISMLLITFDIMLLSSNLIQIDAVDWNIHRRRIVGRKGSNIFKQYLNELTLLC